MAFTEQWSGVRALEMRVAGAWVPAGERATFGIDDPATGQVVAEAPEATAADVDRAVLFAAMKAFVVLDRSANNWNDHFYYHSGS